MSLAFQLTRTSLLSDSDDVVFDGHIVRRQIVERGSVRSSAIVQLEARVVPGTAERLAHDDSLLKRCPVMGTLRSDSEPVGLNVNEQHRLPKRVPGDELTGLDAADLDSFGQIGPGQFL